MRRSSKILALSAVVAAAMSLVPGTAAAAGSITGSFTVTANVAAKCTTVTASNVAVTYDPFAATANTFTNAINVTCTKGSPFTTSLSSANSWKLKGTTSPTTLVSYTVNQTTAAGPDWTTVPFAGTSTSKSVPVVQTAFFSIASGLDLAVDSYVDTITVTVNY